MAKEASKKSVKVKENKLDNLKDKIKKMCFYKQRDETETRDEG